MGNRHLCNPVCAGFLLFKSQPCSTGKGYSQAREEFALEAHFFHPGARLTYPSVPRDGFVNYVQPCLEKGVALEGKATFHTSLPRTLFKWKFFQMLPGDHRTYKM